MPRQALPALPAWLCDASRATATSEGSAGKAGDFQQVRFAVHLCVGARALLSHNRIWGMPTVPLGLMNGARGVVVAILYAPPGTDRVDGNSLAVTGFPRATPGFFPRGQVACPLPEYVVVHFPGYAGPSLLGCK